MVADNYCVLDHFIYAIKAKCWLPCANIAPIIDLRDYVTAQTEWTRDEWDITVYLSYVHDMRTKEVIAMRTLLAGLTQSIINQN